MTGTGPIVQDDDELPSGTALVGGRYAVITCVGTGGSARVYRARGEDGQDIALKVLLPSRAQNPAEVRRLQLEHTFGAALAEVGGVLRALEFGRVPELGDRPYVAFPFVRGEELDVKLTQGALSPPAAARTVVGLARVLQRVHERGVLHRDIKPSNVMVTDGGDSLLLDFGVARWLDPQRPTAAYEDEGGTPLTRTHELVGTQHYMSPEQATGGPPSVSWDLYALGMTLYEALVGDCAFSDLSPRASLQRRCVPGAAPFSIAERRPKLDPGLIAFVDRALAPDPADRFGSAAAFADGLQAVMDPGLEALETGARPRASKRPRTGTHAGRYTLGGLLGEGGCSQVHRAVDGRTGEAVALKLLIERYKGRPERERFIEDEAEALRRIGPHPHIVGLREGGRLPGSDWPFVALELLEGVSIAEHIRDDPAAPRQVAHVAMQVALALRASHRAGVVHRDVTPGNVLLEEGSGRAVLIDFSHCAWSRAPRVPVGHPDRRTRHGEVPGSAQAMSPEQARAEPGTPAMDVFAFGVLLFEMLTARAPFPDYANRDVFIAMQAREEHGAPVLRAGSVEGAPAALTELVNACVEMDADARPSMDAVVRTLEGVLASMSMAAPPMTALLEVRGEDAGEVEAVMAHEDMGAAEAMSIPIPTPIGRGWGRWVSYAVIAVGCVALVVSLAEVLGSGGPAPESAVAAPRAVAAPLLSSPRESGSTVQAAAGPSAEPRPKPPAEPNGEPTLRASPQAVPRVRREPKGAARADLPRKASPPQAGDAVADEPKSPDAEPTGSQTPPKAPRNRCTHTRQQAETSAEDQRWSSVLRATRNAKCWPDNRKRLLLRLAAMRHTSNYAACVELATQLKDRRTAKFCSSKLDPSNP